MRAVFAPLLMAAVFWPAPLHAQSAPSSPDFFADKVYPVLEEANCRICHTTVGVASGTHVHFPEKGATRNQIESFGLSLIAVVNRAAPENSLLFVKPTNRIKHTGGLRIKPGTEQESALLAWVRYLAATPEETLTAERRKLSDRVAPDTQAHLLRRLTHSQYDNTVRDLLGDYSRPALRFPPEDYIDGFKNQLRYQTMPPLLVDAYSTAAEKLALNAFRAGDINHLIPCKPAGPNDTACRDRFLRNFGYHAFRRPLRDAEFRRYAAAFTAQSKQTGKFLEGARLIVEAMLDSPDFLFHAESGPDEQSPDYEIASRLSYFLWDSMPDEALFDAAAKGYLRTDAGREAQARRMLSDSKAHQALDEFFDEWLRFDRVLNASKESRRFPDFSLEMSQNMVEETRRLLDHLVWDNRNFMELFTADYAYVSADLASLYNLAAPSGQFELVKFPADSPRAGILGEASFLAANAGPTETSPTQRGIFIRDQLLCQQVPPPPPNVDTNLPEPSEDRPLTRRQRMTDHVTNPLCASCHRLMDPIGFGLESFDALGRFRSHETILIESPGARRAADKTIDLNLDTAGEVAGIPNSAFSGAKELGSILARSTVCQECIVRQIFRYVYGRMENSTDEETIHQLSESFRNSGFHFRDLLMSMVKSPQFMAGVPGAPPLRSTKIDVTAIARSR